MKNFKITPLLIWMIALLSGCSSDEPGFVEKKAIVPDTRMREWISTQQVSSLDVFRQISTENQNDNIAFSPLSFYVAMSMTANGAGTPCSEEFSKLLKYSDLKEANNYNSQIISTLPYLDKQTSFLIANCILVKTAAEFNPNFQSVVNDSYNSDIIRCNPNDQNGYELANNWIKAYTNGLISNHFDKEDEFKGLCLINAIYFKSPWSKPFNKSNTQNAPFICANGEKVNTPIMHAPAMEGYYAATEDAQILTLPFGNGSYEMTFILPSEGKNVRELITKQSPLELAKLTDRTLQSVDTYLPKFEILAKNDLAKTFKAMGYHEIFNKNIWPNFFYTKTETNIEKILQSVNLKIDEEGGEGSATTTINTGFISPAPSGIVYKADRPFFYMISEKSCGLPLFMGTIEKF
ncbi:MAG: hypothetical protein NC328_07010 [Muribaculum sp.]|nr:hypothetical protein [Muribaculum sp.]